MLALSPLKVSNSGEIEGELENLLEDIDFDDLFVGFDDGDVLPELEVDPAEILAEFSVGWDEQAAAAAPAAGVSDGDGDVDGQENVSPEAETREERSSSPAVPTASSSSSEANKGRKSSSARAKGSQGKRKVKVDWTPELHRRFVQAVEQLGVDKAVPSRILELMGIDCLTRHNIASHLQKYRSHRKHLLAREAEAASWSKRRQMYVTSAGAVKREMNNPWLAPTMGFPPPPMATFGPQLHVWGHPTVDPSLVHLWPKHLVRSPPPWVPPPPDPSYWHLHYPRVPNPLTQGTPFFPQPMPPARFQAPTLPGVFPHPLYAPSFGVPPPSKHSGSQLQLDAHPSKESIDATVGDVLAKPWQPLPLGLKPPSLESVLVELQRQGVSEIPPTCS